MYLRKYPRYVRLINRMYMSRWIPKGFTDWLYDHTMIEKW
jgi:hypothetical protein